MTTKVYEKLNNVWKSTCRIIFGDEIGELKEYEKWLSEYREPFLKKKSAISGKDVYCSTPHYCEGAKFVSLDEVDFNKKFEPLSINEVKDIDSIVEGLQERFYYTGNVTLQNSKFVEGSSDIINSHFVLNSNFIADSQYIAYTSEIRFSKYLFGVSCCAYFNNVIRGTGFNTSNSLESWLTWESNGCYYTINVRGCTDIMFSFGLTGKRNMIGNLQLSKEEYYKTKEKLLEQLRDELIKNKRLPGIFELAIGEPPKVEGITRGNVEETDLAPIENAFKTTTKMILGKELENIDNYKDWLLRNTIGVQEIPSAITGEPTYLEDLIPYTLVPKDRVVNDKESFKASEILKIKEVTEDLRELKERFGRIILYPVQTEGQENKNVTKTAATRNCVDCYYGSIYIENEKCAYSFWPRNSKYIFGSSMAFSSNSCVNCYSSSNISRCFEVDGCSNSAGLYFSHNCENVHDSMFTFNAKNLRYSIGNATYSPDQYNKIKYSILEQITNELEERKDLKWNIYNIGCGK
ncbi:hypothetical protein KAW38_04870 [Candidatus Micrarchaeota archaeon]|nr:hypothetical protein [Candidatus Micrarchaeota archaeon]